MSNHMEMRAEKNEPMPPLVVREAKVALLILEDWAEDLASMRRQVMAMRGIMKKLLKVAEKSTTVASAAK